MDTLVYIGSTRDYPPETIHASIPNFEIQNNDEIDCSRVKKETTIFVQNRFVTKMSFQKCFALQSQVQISSGRLYRKGFTMVKL